LETLGFNSPSLNPENVLPQWQQKIALRAENKACPDSETIWDRMDFLHEVQFSAGIEPAHFLAETTRPLRPRLSAFSPYFYIPYLFAKWQWELRQQNQKNFAVPIIKIRLSPTIVDKIEITKKGGAQKRPSGSRFYLSRIGEFENLLLVLDVLIIWLI